MATDPHVQSVQRKLDERSARGLAKYGVDLTRGDLSELDWLRHLQEELLDGALYAERKMAALSDAKSICEDYEEAARDCARDALRLWQSPKETNTLHEFACQLEANGRKDLAAAIWRGIEAAERMAADK